MEQTMLVKEREAANILAISVQTLRNWRCLRRGPAYVKIGGAVRYQPTDLEVYAAMRRIDPEYGIAKED